MDRSVLFTMALLTAFEGFKYADVGELAHKVMAAAHELHGDDDTLFRAACAALILLARPGDKERVKREVAALVELSAAIAGTPVDLERLALIAMAQDEKPIGLMRIWLETKNGGGH